MFSVYVPDLLSLLVAKVTCVMRWALAVVGVHTIYTHTTILAVVAWAIIDVMLAVLTCEAWRTERDKTKTDKV